VETYTTTWHLVPVARPISCSANLGKGEADRRGTDDRISAHSSSLRIYMLNFIGRWYQRKSEIHEFENSPDNSICIWPSFYIDYHWSARGARTLVAFYLQNWQSVWGTTIGLLNLYFAVLALK
jgi:hypothetical protein